MWTVLFLILNVIRCSESPKAHYGLVCASCKNCAENMPRLVNCNGTCFIKREMKSGSPLQKGCFDPDYHCFESHKQKIKPKPQIICYECDDFDYCNDDFPFHFQGAQTYRKGLQRILYSLVIVVAIINVT